MFKIKNKNTNWRKYQTFFLAIGGASLFFFFIALVFYLNLPVDFFQSEQTNIHNYVEHVLKPYEDMMYLALYDDSLTVYTISLISPEKASVILNTIIIDHSEVFIRKPQSRFFPLTLNATSLYCSSIIDVSHQLRIMFPNSSIGYLCVANAFYEQVTFLHKFLEFILEDPANNIQKFQDFDVLSSFLDSFFKSSEESFKLALSYYNKSFTEKDLSFILAIYNKEIVPAHKTYCIAIMFELIRDKV